MKITELKMQMPVNKLPYEKPVLVILNGTSKTDGKAFSLTQETTSPSGRIDGPS
jgi:hypothetical protein